MVLNWNTDTLLNIMENDGALESQLTCGHARSCALVLYSVKVLNLSGSCCFAMGIAMVSNQVGNLL